MTDVQDPPTTNGTVVPIEHAAAPAVPAGSPQGQMSKYDQLFRLAQRVAGTEFAQNYRNRPEALFACYVKGAEVGLEPMQSIESIDVISNKPTLKPEVMRALIRQHGHDYDIVEMSSERCVIKAHRREWMPDRWTEYSFTIEDAKKMELATKDNYKKQPKVMLAARCTSLMGRMDFPDVLKGLSYTPEEMSDYIETTATTAPRDLYDTSVADERPAITGHMDADGASLPVPGSADDPADVRERASLKDLQTAYATLETQGQRRLKKWWKESGLITGDTWPAKTLEVFAAESPPELVERVVGAIEMIRNGEVPEPISPDDPEPDEPASAPKPVSESNDPDGEIVDAELVEDATAKPAARKIPAPPPPGPTPAGDGRALEILKAVMREQEITGPSRFKIASQFFDRKITNWGQMSDGEMATLSGYLDSEDFAATSRKNVKSAEAAAEEAFPGAQWMDEDGDAA